MRDVAWEWEEKGRERIKGRKGGEGRKGRKGGEGRKGRKGRKGGEERTGQKVDNKKSKGGSQRGRGGDDEESGSEAEPADPGKPRGFLGTGGRREPRRPVSREAAVVAGGWETQVLREQARGEIQLLLQLRDAPLRTQQEALPQGLLSSGLCEGRPSFYWGTRLKRRGFQSPTWTFWLSPVYSWQISYIEQGKSWKWKYSRKTLQLNDSLSEKVAINFSKTLKNIIKPKNNHIFRWDNFRKAKNKVRQSLMLKRSLKNVSKT